MTKPIQEQIEETIDGFQAWLYDCEFGIMHGDAKAAVYSSIIRAALEAYKQPPVPNNEALMAVNELGKHTVESLSHGKRRALEAKIRQALTQRTETMKSQWRPIETAPKNWTEIIVYQRASGLDSDVFTAYFSCEDGGRSGWVCTANKKNCFPTHWMPLPKPPTKVDE